MKAKGASAADTQGRPRFSAARRAPKAEVWVTTRLAPWLASIMSLNERRRNGIATRRTRNSSPERSIERRTMPWWSRPSSSSTSRMPGRIGWNARPSASTRGPNSLWLAMTG